MIYLALKRFETVMTMCEMLYPPPPSHPIVSHVFIGFQRYTGMPIKKKEFIGTPLKIGMIYRYTAKINSPEYQENPSIPVVTVLKKKVNIPLETLCLHQFPVIISTFSTIFPKNII